MPEFSVAMTETNAALLASLPSDVRDLLANPPLTNTRLLELATNQPGESALVARESEQPPHRQLVGSQIR